MDKDGPAACLGAISAPLATVFRSTLSFCVDVLLTAMPNSTKPKSPNSPKTPLTAQMML